jgi:hypothetical protein
LVAGGKRVTRKRGSISSLSSSQPHLRACANHNDIVLAGNQTGVACASSSTGFPTKHFPYSKKAATAVKLSPLFYNLQSL